MLSDLSSLLLLNVLKFLKIFYSINFITKHTAIIKNILNIDKPAFFAEESYPRGDFLIENDSKLDYLEFLGFLILIRFFDSIVS